MSNKRDLLSKTKLEFYNEVKKFQSQLKPTKEIEGYGSSAIVGERGYPEVKIHNISNNEKENSFFNSSNVVKKDYSQIIKLKARNILGSTDYLDRRKLNDRISQSIADIYKSKKPIEFSSNFEDELKFNKIMLNKVSGIVGSKNPLISVEPNENTKTSMEIEKTISGDLKATEAVISLYESGVNEHQIINLLSLGCFGMELNKKRVPTRWAISAYDQIIEKYLHKKITNFQIQNKFEVYSYSDKGNFFVILLFPHYFSGEVVEAWDNFVERDYVGFDNKLHKKEPETAGGFYATKIAVFESLVKKKKQAGFVSLRFIKDYEIPLGVVFVREAAREAMKNKTFVSNNFEEINVFLKENFPVHFRLFKNSKVIDDFRNQKKITDYI